MTRTHEIKLDGYGAHTTLAEDRPIMLLGTAESYGIEMLHIVPGKDWAELTITATFNASDGSSTDILMDTDGNVVVPSEATAKSGSGRIVFTGVSNGIQRISCDLEYFVVAHSAINGVQSGGTAPSWFEQAVTRFMPAGGAAGQVLTKLTDTDFEAEWQDSQGGAGLEPLVGTNETLTPTQVREAFLQGQPIVFSFIDASGEVAAIFQSFEIYDDIIVASTILPRFDSQGMGVGLVIGYLLSNVWEISETEITNPDDIQTAINTALAAAKASGEFDGADGITPTIGENGNWFLGDVDTNKPSRGTDGKSAYSYAQDGGYIGTEEEFAAKLAADKLPNPYPLTITGAVSETYDGSSAKTIKIPSGGAYTASYTVREDVSSYTLNIDTSKYSGYVIFVRNSTNKAPSITINREHKKISFTGYDANTNFFDINIVHNDSDDLLQGFCKLQKNNNTAAAYYSYFNSVNASGTTEADNGIIITAETVGAGSEIFVRCI